MRIPLLVGLVGVGVFAAPRLARAEAWYYSWSCTGECAPGQLAISGEEGPFETREECDRVRSQDPRADYFVQPGNLGGLDFCTNREGQYGYRPPAGGGGYGGGEPGGPRRPPTIARFEIGGLLGPAYRVETPAGYEDGSGGTAGADIRFQTGNRPELGGEIVVGIQYSSVTTPHYGAEAKPMIFVPWMIGLASTPALARGKREYRLDLGFDVGGLSRVGCSDCASEMLPTHAFVLAARAGIDTYFGADGNQGIGIDGVFQWSHHGTVDRANPASFAIVPPMFLLRISLIVRTRDTVAW